MRSAFIDIIRARGFRGLYAGLTPTLVEIVPYAGLQFGTYDTFKRWTIASLLYHSNFFFTALSCSLYCFLSHSSFPWNDHCSPGTIATTPNLDQLIRKMASQVFNFFSVGWLRGHVQNLFAIHLMWLKKDFRYALSSAAGFPNIRFNSNVMEFSVDTYPIKLVSIWLWFLFNLLLLKIYVFFFTICLPSFTLLKNTHLKSYQTLKNKTSF